MVVNTLFLSAIWGPLDAMGRTLYGEIRAFRNGREAQQLFTRVHEEAMQFAMDLSNDRWDVYYGVLRRTGKRGTALDTVEATHVLWADFDAKHFRAKTGINSAYSELANMRLVPHIIVDSGHGYHAYWNLDMEYEFTRAQQVMKGIERVHRSDHTSDAPRILRLPGTMNYKDASPLPVRLVRYDLGRPYSLDAFNEYAFTPERPATRHNGTGDWTPSTSDAPKFPEGHRNNGLAKVGAAMVHKGLTPLDVLDALLIENEMRCDPPLPVNEVAAIAQSVERYRDE